MGSGNEPENMSPDYIVGRIDALDDAQQRIAELEAELACLRRMEQRWHKLLDEAEPSPEFLSGEAFQLKTQSNKDQC